MHRHGLHSRGANVDQSIHHREDAAAQERVRRWLGQSEVLAALRGRARTQKAVRLAPDPGGEAPARWRPPAEVRGAIGGPSPHARVAPWIEDMRSMPAHLAAA